MLTYTTMVVDCGDFGEFGELVTFGVAFHFFVRHFKFGMWVEHSKSHSQATDDKGAWSLFRDLCNFWNINDNISKTYKRAS